jgi:cation diffusion facilitator CzcD-associated flavoprotein CzcO
MPIWSLLVVVSSFVAVSPTLPLNFGADNQLRTGWFGLAAAKTYLRVHPDAKVVVLEAESSVGGVWATSRLYPRLKSNNMLGTYEYSDFPMDETTWAIKPGEHIPGKVMHDYLTKYAERFGVLQHIRFNSKVESAEREEKGGWLLKISKQQGSILAKKLVVATGMTSQAFVPTIEGQESFGVPLFHSKDFKQHAATLETAKTVTVLGGTKSAWDAVYAYASKGIEVNWVIRGMVEGFKLHKSSILTKVNLQNPDAVLVGWLHHMSRLLKSGWRSSSILVC